MAAHDRQLLILFIVVDLNAFVKTQYNMMMPYQQPVNFQRSEVTDEESKTLNVPPGFPPGIIPPQYSYPMLLSVPFAPLYAPGLSYFEPVVHDHPPVRRLVKYSSKDNRKQNIDVTLLDDSLSSDSDSQEEYVDGGKKRIDRRMMIIKNKAGYAIVNPDRYPKKYKDAVSYFDNIISKLNKAAKKKT